MIEATAQPGAAAAAARPREASIVSLAAVPGALSVPNADRAEAMGVTPAWIMKRIGVSERRVAPPDQPLWALAAEAGRAAIERAGLAPAAIDAILVATCTHDHVMPSAAALVGGELGAAHAAAMDVNAVCNGFVSAVAMGSAAIEAGRFDSAVVIGADVLSRWVDASDRRTAPVFGDGAGAVVLAPASGAGRIGATVLRGDGDGAGLIRCPRDGTMRMEGEETYRHAVARLAEVTLAVLERGGLKPDAIDLFVYHQANVRILRAVGDRLGIEADRVVNAMTLTGNTTAASIPLALAHAAADGRLRPGARVLAAGFGSGLSFGAMVVDWEAAT